MENKTMENEEITKYTITTEIPIYIRLAKSIKPISDIRAVLDRIEREGATHIEFDYGIDGDVEITVLNRRLETDEEYSQRKQKEEIQRNSNDEREFKEYERLKKKFEK